jgi:hypothetical protein
MKKKLVFAFNVLLVFGLLFTACDNGNSPGSSGTFKIRITEIPSNVMTAGSNGQISIGIGPANALQSDGSNAFAGRGTDIYSGDDRSGPDWYEFYLYNLNNYQTYIGNPGNYDIGFINNSNNSIKVIRNIKLEVNTVNLIPYGSFSDVPGNGFSLVGNWKGGDGDNRFTFTSTTYVFDIGGGWGTFSGSYTYTKLTSTTARVKCDITGGSGPMLQYALGETYEVDIEWVDNDNFTVIAISETLEEGPRVGETWKRQP